MFVIDPKKVDKMFDRNLGEYEGMLGEILYFEEPIDGHQYVTAADWAKREHNTVVWTLDISSTPARLVAYQRQAKIPWPDIVSKFEFQARKYRGEAIHDATGLGTVVDDMLTIDAYPMVMAGRARKDMFSNYIGAIENEEIVAPYINTAHSEHKYMRHKDVYGSGHPPDSFAAASLAWVISGGGWSRGSVG